MASYFIELPPVSGGGGGAVDSVNGQTGVVVLTKSNIGLGNVDNTSDLNKAISTATQAALDLKANLSAIPFSVSDVNTVAVTGTTTETLVASLFIPANTLPASCVLQLIQRTITNGTQTGTGTVRLYTNTSNSLSGALQFFLGTISSAQVFVQPTRTILIEGGRLAVLGLGIVSDATVATSVEVGYAFDVTVDNYILVSIRNSATGDNRSHRLVTLNRIG